MKISGLRVLFTGPLTAGGTCEMRRRTLEKCGASTFPLSHLSFFTSRFRLVRRMQWWLRRGKPIDNYNHELIVALGDYRPDVLWVEKGLFVRRDVLQFAKRVNAAIIHYSPDNYFIAQNTSRYFERSLSAYDLVVTTKVGAEKKLLARGAVRTFLSGNAYDEEMHKPVRLTGAELQRFGCEVTFIGRWEPNREELIERIIEAGVAVKIWGPNWDKARLPGVRGVAGGPAETLDYSRAICGAAITLCLLSRLAMDTITQRSVEIPACGGFMLAERSGEHLAHFEEGKEAEFFGDHREMMEKIRHYLANPAERIAIAAAGRERCIRSGYSYAERLTEIFQQLPDPAQRL